MMLLLSYTCPKRKCRHTWEVNSSKVIDGDCPRCGAHKIAPVDVEVVELS